MATAFLLSSRDRALGFHPCSSILGTFEGRLLEVVPACSVVAVWFGSNWLPLRLRCISLKTLSVRNRRCFHCWTQHSLLYRYQRPLIRIHLQFEIGICYQLLNRFLAHHLGRLLCRSLSLSLVCRSYREFASASGSSKVMILGLLLWCLFLSFRYVAILFWNFVTRRFKCVLWCFL